MSCFSVWGRKKLVNFQQKWTPVLRRKMRKNKELERPTEPSEVKTALVSCIIVILSRFYQNQIFESII